MLTIGVQRELIRTRHGLDLVPRHDLASAPGLDRLLIPGQPDAAAAAPAEGWAVSRGIAAERIHAAGGYPYDLTLTDLAHQDTRLIARDAARWIEYPTAQLELGDRDWQLALILRGIALTVLSPALLLGIKRALGRRRAMALYGQAATA